jgi:hypothetical protein
MFSMNIGVIYRAKILQVVHIPSSRLEVRLTVLSSSIRVLMSSNTLILFENDDDTWLTRTNLPLCWRFLKPSAFWAAIVNSSCNSLAYSPSLTHLHLLVHSSSLSLLLGRDYLDMLYNIA